MEIDYQKFVNAARENINSIISISVLLEKTAEKEQKNAEKESDTEKAEILSFHSQNLLDYSCKLLNQAANFSYLCDDKNELSTGNPKVINLIETIEEILRECREKLKHTRRKIEFRDAAEEKGVKIDGKVFTDAFMNIIQNALLYSPKEKKIKINASNEDGELVLVTENGVCVYDEGRGERSGLGLPATDKIIASAGGSLDFKRAGKKATVTVKLPLVPLDGGEPTERLKADFQRYTGERFKSVNLFLNEIIGYEKI